MDGYVSAGQKTARGIPITEVDGEEVVCAGVTVVRHVERKANFRFSYLPAAGDVRLVAVEGERRDFH